MKKYLLILTAAMTVVACSNDSPVEDIQVEEPKVEEPQVDEPQAEDTPEMQDSVGGQSFGCAASFRLPSTIQLSDQNFAVVHSAEELAGIEIQNQKLPNVDFGENDLVIGVVRTPDSGYGIEKIDLKEEGDEFLACGAP